MLPDIHSHGTAKKHVHGVYWVRAREREREREERGERERERGGAEYIYLRFVCVCVCMYVRTYVCMYVCMCEPVIPDGCQNCRYNLPCPMFHGLNVSGARRQLTASLFIRGLEPKVPSAY